MLSYLFLLCFCGFFAIIESVRFKDRFFKDNIKYLSYFLFCFLLLFIGLRYKVGADWYQYFVYFNTVEDLGTVLFDSKNAPLFYDHNWEPGFKLLCVLLKSIGISYQGLVFAITAFNIYSLSKFIGRFLDNEKCLFVMLFLSLNMLREFDILRQSLSFYIFLFAFKYINENFLKYLAVCLIASLFHLSAIVLIVVYPFFKVRITKRLLWFTLVIFVMGTVFKLRFLSIFVDFLEKVLPVNATTVILHQVKLYLELYPVQSSINFVTLLAGMALLLLIKYYKDLTNFDSRFISCFLIFLYFSIFFSEIGEIQSRFGYYFSVGLVYCISRMVNLFYTGYFRLAYVLFIIVYANIKVILPFRIEATLLTYTPYRNFLFYLDESEVEETHIMNRYYKAHELSQDFFQDNIEN